MGRKIFVSYKHSDSDVRPLLRAVREGLKTTARHYVDELWESLANDGEIFKGEANEDLSKFKDETIESHLRDKIYDSSMTVVLISPNMKDESEKESDQWIPWEISYSLKEPSRNNRTSYMNAVIAVVLPDHMGSYGYYYATDHICSHYGCRGCRAVDREKLFRILSENMLNKRQKEVTQCPEHHPYQVMYAGNSSYILSAKWDEFIADRQFYLDIAEAIRDDATAYDIKKVVSDD